MLNVGVFLLVILFATIANAKLAVNAAVGTILGRRSTDGNYTMFTGIPYADVDPKNPFGLSSRHPNFAQPFEAYNDSIICPQNSVTLVPASIDCLQLNVYVPDMTSPATPKAVIVWSHGGSFIEGSGNRILNIGPKFIVRHDVILVSYNYRLGPYGFMCLKTPEVPGNQGLKDQLLALRWVKENIEYFGGDPNNITLGGDSAGSYSVHLHVLSPEEALYDRIILMSGSAFIAKEEREGDPTAVMKIARILGLETGDVSECLLFLASQNTSSVLKASTTAGLRFNPCLETNSEIDERILPSYPLQLNGSKIKGKAVLQGFTSDELIFRYAGLTAETYANLTVFQYNLDRFFFNLKRKGLFDELLHIIKNYYLGGRGFSEETKFNISNLDSDMFFYHPALRSIRHFLKNGATEVYQYKFSYLGGRNLGRLLNNMSFGGAAHGDDTGYLFDSIRLYSQPSAKDQLMIDRLTSMWANFAKYGNPTPETSTLLPVKWEPNVSGDTVYKYLEIDSELSMQVNPFNERMAFWDLMYQAYGEYQTGYNFAISLHSANILSISLGILLMSF